MDQFNRMLQGLSQNASMPHVRFVDLRGTLEWGAKYQEDWGNELHPTRDGFVKVVKKFEAALASLP